ncbi:MAG TPA: hypothetical protein VI298_00990 [Geobacteraceae bacterium]
MKLIIFFVFILLVFMLLLLDRFLKRGDEPDMPFSGGITSVRNGHVGAPIAKDRGFAITFHTSPSRSSEIVNFETLIDLPPEIAIISTYEEKGIVKSIVSSRSIKWKASKKTRSNKYYSINMQSVTNSTEWSKPIEVISKIWVNSSSNQWPSGCYEKKIYWLNIEYRESAWEKCMP